MLKTFDGRSGIRQPQFLCIITALSSFPIALGNAEFQALDIEAQAIEEQVGF